MNGTILITVPDTANFELSRFNKMSWSTVSKAELRSNKISKVRCWLFIFNKLSFLTLNKDVSVLKYRLDDD